MISFKSILALGLASAMLGLAIACTGSGSGGSSQASTYPITASAGAHGSITPSGTMSIAAGSTQAFTFTPDPGYVVASLSVDGAILTGAISAYTFSAVQAAHTISVAFQPAPAFTITASAGPGGGISPGTTAVAPGADQTFAITPNPGYGVASVVVDGTDMGAMATYAFTAVESNHSIGATFQLLPTFAIQVTPGPGGSISPLDTQVPLGGSQAFTITPGAGYTVAQVTVDGSPQGSLTSYTFSGVKASHTLSATFAAVPQAVLISAGAGSNGAISPAGDLLVGYGGIKTFTFMPAAGYVTSSISVDGNILTGDLTTYTFSNVTTPHSIQASFQPAPETCSIAVTSGANGAISPGDTVVATGGGQTFTITPNPGYQIASVLKDGVSQGAIATCSFSSVKANHTLSATFAIAPPAPAQLQGYGFNTAYSEPIDPLTGTAVAKGYNPLGGQSTIVSATREVFMTGDSEPGSYPDWTLLPSLAQGAQYWSDQPTVGPTGASWFMNSPLATASGDLLGTGKDSVVLVYYSDHPASIDPSYLNADTDYNNTVMQIYDANGMRAQALVPYALHQNIYPFRFDKNTHCQGQVSLALGDFDGSGSLEAAMLVDTTFQILKINYVPATPPALGTLTLTELYSFDFRNDPNDPNSDPFYQDMTHVWWSCRLAVGDINGDGRDEVVVVRNIMNQNNVNGGGVFIPARYHVYGCPTQGSAPVELAAGVVGDANANNLIAANVAIGDLIGDGSRQVFFSGAQFAYYSSGLLGGQNIFSMFNVMMGTWKPFGSLSGDGTILLPGGSQTMGNPLANNNYSRTWQIMPSLCFSPVPGQAQQLLALDRVIQWNPDQAQLVTLCYLPEVQGGTPNFIWGGLQQIKAGDVDGDGQEELVSLYLDDSPGNSALLVYKTVGANGPMTASAMEKLNDWSDPNLGNNAADKSQVFTSLCLPDLNGNSLRLRYTGQKGYILTNPTVLAVIASPPYWGSLAGQYGNLNSCFTSSGNNQGGGTSNSNGFELDASVFFGHKTEIKIPELGIDFGSSWKVTVKGSLTYSATHAVSYSSSQAFATPAGQDQVIVTCIPSDVYLYQVLNPVTNSDGTVNDYMTICIPRSPQTLPIEFKTYNAVPANTRTIPTSFLDHSIGLPFSYMDYSAMQNLMTGSWLWDSTGLSIGINGGYATSTAEQTISNANSVGVGIGLEYEEDNEIEGWDFGWSVSMTYNHTWEFTTTNGTQISGASPGLPLDTTDLGKLYTFGVGSYTKYLPTQGNTVGVVSYWVQPSN